VQSRIISVAFYLSRNTADKVIIVINDI